MLQVAALTSLAAATWVAGVPTPMPWWAYLLWMNQAMCQLL